MDAIATRIFLPGVIFLPGQDAFDGQGDCIEPGLFIAGEENWFALAAVQRMIEADPPHCFTVFGPTGTGKTHLLKLLCRLWKEIWRGSSILFWNAADFGREFAEAIAARKVRQFRRKWEAANFLVLDDLQFLPEYPAAQEEFVVMLRAAERGRLRVAVGSRLPPWYDDGFDRRIGAILQGGLSAPLRYPGEDARRALLRMAFREKSLAITDAALQVFVEEVTGSPRQILGFATKVRQAVGQGMVDYPTARAFLRQYRPRPTATIDRVAKATARYYGLRLKDLRGPGRTRSEVFARNVAMYLAQKLTGASLQQIGQYFGGRDHTTVGYGCRKIERLVRSDPSLRKAIMLIEEQVIPGETTTFSRPAADLV